jgi:hypothetical protein
MKKLTYEQIYKLYKRGGSLKDLRNDDIFNSLKNNKLQVVLVNDINGFERIYNFIPEKNKFYRVV